jgi:death-on-curing protein
MGQHDYLTVADVLGMHTVLMKRYGGAKGVRDPGALESALFRPQTGYYDDIVAEAAALLESLAINHPFVDGNKRIAFAAADVFLRINGWRLQRAPMQIHAEMIQMFDSGTFDIAHLDPWLRGFAVPAGDASGDHSRG